MSEEKRHGQVAHRVQGAVLSAGHPLGEQQTGAEGVPLELLEVVVHQQRAPLAEAGEPAPDAAQLLEEERLPAVNHRGPGPEVGAVVLVPDEAEQRPTAVPEERPEVGLEVLPSAAAPDSHLEDLRHEGNEVGGGGSNQELPVPLGIPLVEGLPGAKHAVDVQDDQRAHELGRGTKGREAGVEGDAEHLQAIVPREGPALPGVEAEALENPTHEAASVGNPHLRTPRRQLKDPGFVGDPGLQRRARLVCLPRGGLRSTPAAGAPGRSPGELSRLSASSPAPLIVVTAALSPTHPAAE